MWVDAKTCQKALQIKGELTAAEKVFSSFEPVCRELTSGQIGEKRESFWKDVKGATIARACRPCFE